MKCCLKKIAVSTKSYTSPTGSGRKNTVTITGSRIWHCNSEQQAASAGKYLRATLNHYRRMQSGNSADVQHIIDAYSEVKLNALIKWLNNPYTATVLRKMELISLGFLNRQETTFYH